MTQPPQLNNGDCVKVLADYPSNYFDFACFSPPYDAIRDYKGFDWNPGELRKQLYRVLKHNSICAMVIQDQTKDCKKSGTSFTIAADWIANEWSLFEAVIYYRDGIPGGYWSRRFRVDHEYVFLFMKGERPEYFDKRHMMIPCKNPDKATWHAARKADGSLERTFYASNATKCKGTIWRYAPSSSEGNAVKVTHPATYPDALARDLIKCFCPEEGKVLDPMCGSGSTIIAAEQCNRKGFGVEISEEYCDIIKRRLANEIKPRLL